MWMTDGLSVVRVIFRPGCEVQCNRGRQPRLLILMLVARARNRSSIPMEIGTRGALRVFLCKVRVLSCKCTSPFGLLQVYFPFWSAASASRAAAVKVGDVSGSDSCHEWPRNQNGSQKTQVRPWKQQGAGLAGLASGVPHLEALVFETLGPIKEELSPPFFQVRGTNPRKQFRGRLRKLVVESLACGHRLGLGLGLFGLGVALLTLFSDFGSP